MSVVRSERLYYGVEIEYNDAYKKFYEEEGNWDGPGDYFPEITWLNNGRRTTLDASIGLELKWL